MNRSWADLFLRLSGISSYALSLDTGILTDENSKCRRCGSTYDQLKRIKMVFITCQDFCCRSCVGELLGSFPCVNHQCSISHIRDVHSHCPGCNAPFSAKGVRTAPSDVEEGQKLQIELLRERIRILENQLENQTGTSSATSSESDQSLTGQLMEVDQTPQEITNHPPEAEQEVDQFVQQPDNMEMFGQYPRAPQFDQFVRNVEPLPNYHQLQQEGHHPVIEFPEAEQEVDQFVQQPNNMEMFGQYPHPPQFDQFVQNVEPFPNYQQLQQEGDQAVIEFPEEFYPQQQIPYPNYEPMAPPQLPYTQQIQFVVPANPHASHITITFN